MTVRAGADPNISLVPVTHYTIPPWVGETQLFEPSLLPPMEHISRELKLEAGLGLETWYSKIAYPYLNPQLNHGSNSHL